MSSDLRAELERVAAQIVDLSVLSEEALGAIVERVAKRFIVDRTVNWWWTSIRPEFRSKEIPYGDSDAWAAIRGTAPPRGVYVLIATGEEAVPACAFRGSLAALAELVAESAFFEYVVTDEDASFAVFDTHHNALVTVARR
jgi:hypothetical protein